MKKKMTVYAHYYYPDVASTGQILMELAEGLKDKFNITIICVVPSYEGKIDEKYKKNRFYKEEINGIKIIRVRVPEFNKNNKVSRIKNLLAYFLNSIMATCRLEKQDYIFSISQPPILGGILGVIGKVIKGGKFIYNIQDFNPEQIMAVGYIKNNVILNLAKKIDKFSCKHSDEVIVVGRDMQETLKNRFNNGIVPKNVFINNWIDEHEIYPINKFDNNVSNFIKNNKLDNKFVIMYSGNIGLYYDLENIIKVIGRFKERKDIVFAFVGEGTVKSKIEEYSITNKLENVVFIPYQAKEDLRYSLNSADIHLVVNAKGIKGVSVPSKLYGVMACAKPVLGVLDNESEGRLIIEESDCGICSDPMDYEQLYKNINYILKNKDKFIKKGNNGRNYLERYLNKNLSISKYRENILSI